VQPRGAMIYYMFGVSLMRFIIVKSVEFELVSLVVLVVGK
jgi:hypothetical protein